MQIVNFGLWQRGPVRRFQTVGTHPQHRRKGAAARLVYEASREALADGAEVLVMVADELEDARRVYARVGFGLTERVVGLTWSPESHRA